MLPPIRHSLSLSQWVFFSSPTCNEQLIINASYNQCQLCIWILNYGRKSTGAPQMCELRAFWFLFQAVKNVHAHTLHWLNIAFMILHAADYVSPEFFKLGQAWSCLLRFISKTHVVELGWSATALITSYSWIWFTCTESPQSDLVDLVVQV
jgi:hypothetical protein